MRSLVSKRLAFIVMRVAPSSRSRTASRSSAYSPLRSNHVTIRPYSSRALSSSASREASIPLTSYAFPRTFSHHRRLRGQSPFPRKRITRLLEGMKTDHRLHRRRLRRTYHSTYQYRRLREPQDQHELDLSSTATAMDSQHHDHQQQEIR